jgi:hypothetical protein
MTTPFISSSDNYNIDTIPLVYENHEKNNKPTYIYKEEDIVIKEWRVNGLLHRENGPARIHIDPEISGTILEWRVNGLLHRENGPARIIIDDDDILIFWFQNGILHRENGPAIINKNKESKTISKSWFIQGQKYTYEDYIDYLIELTLLVQNDSIELFLDKNVYKYLDIDDQYETIYSDVYEYISTSLF